MQVHFSHHISSSESSTASNQEQLPSKDDLEKIDKYKTDMQYLISEIDKTKTKFSSKDKSKTTKQSKQDKMVSQTIIKELEERLSDLQGETLF